MIAFEQSRIKLPAKKAPWAPAMTDQLYNELDYFEYKLTSGGRLTYSAPKGLHDDMVMALALANWGRFRGVAGGIAPAEVVIEHPHHSRDSLVRMRSRDKMILKRPNPMRSKIGFESSGFLWR
jgi:hypothetical protein